MRDGGTGCNRYAAAPANSCRPCPRCTHPTGAMSPAVVRVPAAGRRRASPALYSPCPCREGVVPDGRPAATRPVRPHAGHSRARRSGAARGPVSARRATAPRPPRRRRRPGRPAWPRWRRLAHARPRQPRQHDPVGPARRRQDHHRPPARRRRRPRLPAAVRHLRRAWPSCAAPSTPPPAGAPGRPRHPPLRRRDPPLQPRPAGRLPPRRRGRHRSSSSAPPPRTRPSP